MERESLGIDMRYVRSSREQFLNEYLKIVNNLIEDEEGKSDEQTIYTQYIKELIQLKSQIDDLAKNT